MSVSIINDRVDPGSVCEQHGLQVGDQILTVNNTSFRNILHNEAASILKNNQLLIMTVKVKPHSIY